MARKTIDVQKVRQRANELPALPDGGLGGDAAWINADFRQGVAALLNYVLHESGNYRGFNLLQASEFLPADQQDYTTGKVRRDGADETRKVFF